MNDTLREYCSYGNFIIPLLKVKKILKPIKIQWGNKSQYFLYYTSSNSKNKTLVIYIHGGGWNSGSPSDFHFIGQKIALKGYDCIMLGYRKSPKYHYDDIIADIFKGFSEVKQYILTQKLDYSKIIVMGSSAGAHLGALLCYDLKQQQKYAIHASEFHGFISLGGPLCFDLPQTYVLNKLMKDLFSSKDLSVWKQGEPILKLASGQNTRMLIIQSKHDGVVGFQQAEKFYKKAITLGISAELCDVLEKQNTHSAYSAGIFLKEPEESSTLCKLFNWIAE